MPPSPRSDAVWLENVFEPITLPSCTLPALLFAEMRFINSTAFVTPAWSISSRPMTWTGSAPSPSMRRMFEPVTSTLMSAAWTVLCTTAVSTMAATAAPRTYR